LARALEGLTQVGRLADQYTIEVELMKIQGEIHPWISRITGAMTQGALADCFKRFPSVATLAILMPGTVQGIIADTKINEKYAVELVKKYHKYIAI
jgi:hypothetical protein